MARSFTKYAASGTDYQVQFPYIDKSHVTVLVDDTAATFTWIDDSNIRLDTDPVGATSVTVQRSSSPDTKLTIYTIPSDIKVDVLNEMVDQMFFLAQEALDTQEVVLTTDIITGQWSMQSLRLTDVADPVNAQDAVTLNYLNVNYTNNINQAVSASEAARDAAQSSETAASSSAASASSHEIKARAWATEDEDVPVEVGEFSAKHWALKSAQSATAFQGPYQSFRNAFVNGGMNVWQRGSSFPGVSTTRAYVADRWALSTSAGTLNGAGRSAVVPPDSPSSFSMSFTIGAGVTSVDVDQRIEAIDARALARAVTFSAYILNTSGSTFTPKIFVSTPAATDNWVTSTVRNGGGSGEDLQPCLPSVWQRVTWSADISDYTNINNGLEFRLRTPSGLMLAGDEVRIADIQIEPGLTATAFEARPRGVELCLCQRYYNKSYRLDEVPGTSGDNGAIHWGQSITYVIGNYSLRFGVSMRAAPTITVYNPNNGNSGEVRDLSTPQDINSVGASWVNENGFVFSRSGSFTGGRAYLAHYTADAEL